jgi:hypothetical protein
LRRPDGTGCGREQPRYVASDTEDAPQRQQNRTGGATYLEGGRSAALGLGGPGAQETVEVTAGTRLVLYTDRLIERRDQPLDDSLDQLAATAAALPAANAQTWCDTLLAALTKDDTLTDDIAIACIDLNEPGQPARP